MRLMCPGGHKRLEVGWWGETKASPKISTLQGIGRGLHLDPRRTRIVLLLLPAPGSWFHGGVASDALLQSAVNQPAKTGPLFVTLPPGRDRRYPFLKRVFVVFLLRLAARESAGLGVDARGYTTVRACLHGTRGAAE